MNRDRKPHYILVECVEAVATLKFGVAYYAVKWHIRDGLVWISVWVDGEVRTFSDYYFRPRNTRHWSMFSMAQRSRFSGHRHANGFRHPRFDLADQSTFLDMRRAA